MENAVSPKTYCRVGGGVGEGGGESKVTVTPQINEKYKGVSTNLSHGGGGGHSLYEDSTIWRQMGPIFLVDLCFWANTGWTSIVCKEIIFMSGKGFCPDILERGFAQIFWNGVQY